MAKVIMVQGTMSNAGKSLICAGLCRVFKQDGYKVAPFKSQNMALNSYITNEGLEMGRAQVVQAEAAGVEPSVYMNPILLKPVTNMGSQVIVHGKSIGNMKAAEYYSMKQSLVPKIMEAFENLSEEYDIIVIEGAGSPAEINLKKGDFVNMGMAKLAKAPVLLVGDIDRGGVFAQLYGTVELLDTDEKDIIKAVIINKFRGDKTLLQDGLNQLENLIHKPVCGVMPMVDVDIDDEDSLTERFEINKKGLIDIAVIKLPRISNFTDFAALEAEEIVGVRYVDKVSDLKNPDMIIIPGTKNTIQDLMHIRENGLEAAIKKMADKGTVVLGICGGYQMLGRTIIDEAGAENESPARIEGMNLLPMDTVFSEEKRRTRVSGNIQIEEGFYSCLNNKNVYGYEIHMGSTSVDVKKIIQLDNGKEDGCFTGNIGGTYLHGFFDSDEVRSALLDRICQAKGIESMSTGMDYKAYKESQYDMLADAIRENLDMKMIYEILDRGVSG